MSFRFRAIRSRRQKTAPYVKQLIGGRLVSNGYDWIKDPKHYLIDGHRPSNRCFHCGLRFIGSEYAAFCNVCDNEMTPENDTMPILIKTGHESYLAPRKELTKHRIRIPNDSTEEYYKNKLDALETTEELNRLLQLQWI